ncbi:MAG: hypothetical protein AAB442_01140 [Patescibacteria group bacterium]
MQHDAWFFIGVFVFIFLIWAATGGPFNSLSFTGPRLALPEELGGGNYLRFPRAPLAVGGGSYISSGGGIGNYSGGGSGGSGGSGSGSAPVPILTGGIPFGEVSPYRGVVSINHGISGAGSVDPRNESTWISVGAGAGVPVDITGWTLLSEATGKSAPIPQGTDIPSSGVVNAIQDIVLSPGERAIIISGYSPIGASFRENKCIGYYATFQKFSPSLPYNCPLPSTELTTFYGGGYIRDPNCIDYINTLPRCQVVLSPPTTISGACQSFAIKYLNYNGCVETHRSDVDFRGNTWRVYLGRTAPLWRSTHEVVKLLDSKGRTVDAFSY